MKLETITNAMSCRLNLEPWNQNDHWILTKISLIVEFCAGTLSDLTR